MMQISEQDAETRERLKEILDLPVQGTDDEAVLFFHPWLAFKGVMQAYDSTIDEMAIRTLEAVRDGTTFELIKGEHGLFVQFFLHLLAGHNYVDYGTSPRAAFPAYCVADLWDQWIEKWKAWFVVEWGRDVEGEAG